MIIVTRCLIFLEFLSRITIILSNSSTESWRPISTGHLRKIPGESIPWHVLRRGDYLYADKSVYLERLLENERGNVFFYITRPRRFGKSSFLLMAKYFFEGDETLFKNLKINDRGNTYFFKKRSGRGVPEELKDKKWIQCPVIYLDFRSIEFDNMSEFKGEFTQMLRNVGKSYGLDCTAERMSVSHLIFELELKFKIKVVVLVDEYDYPFQKALEMERDHGLADKIGIFLDGLFGALKSQGEKLRLVLVLGISRLGLTSLQSGPNSYVDLTYTEEFAGAFGFTSTEIADFQPEIADRFNLNSKEGLDEFLRKLREEYDGYNFTFQYNDGRKENVLNPVSIMKCFKNKNFGCYWSETSNVNEVIRRLFFSRKPLKVWEHSKSSKHDIESRRDPAIESIPLDILMILYGYLTIESYDEKTDEVSLNFPNNEIRTALQEKIAKYNPAKDRFLSNEHGWLIELKWHMDTGCLSGAMINLQQLFDSTTRLSATLRGGMNEYSNTVRLLDRLNAAKISYQESVKFDRTSKEEAGDVDVMTNWLQKNFIMSIKYGPPATRAMDQLIDYLREDRDPFLAAINEPTEAWFVGISFDKNASNTMYAWVGILFKNGALCFDQCEASTPNLCETLRNKNAKQL